MREWLRHDFIDNCHRLKPFSTIKCNFYTPPLKKWWGIIPSENIECPSVYLSDSGYPHDGRADKNPYPHDCRANKDSNPHDSSNQCIILKLQLSFVMINVQLMLV